MDEKEILVSQSSVLGRHEYCRHERRTAGTVLCTMHTARATHCKRTRVSGTQWRLYDDENFNLTTKKRLLTCESPCRLGMLRHSFVPCSVPWCRYMMYAYERVLRRGGGWNYRTATPLFACYTKELCISGFRGCSCVNMMLASSACAVLSNERDLQILKLCCFWNARLFCAA